MDLSAAPLRKSSHPQAVSGGKDVWGQLTCIEKGEFLDRLSIVLELVYLSKKLSKYFFNILVRIFCNYFVILLARKKGLLKCIERGQILSMPW